MPKDSWKKRGRMGAYGNQKLHEAKLDKAANRFLREQGAPVIQPKRRKPKKARRRDARARQAP